MSESEFVRELVQEGIRQATQLEALKNIRLLIMVRPDVTHVRLRL